MIPRIDLIEDIHFRKKLPRNLKMFTSYRKFSHNNEIRATGLLQQHARSNKDSIRSVENIRSSRLGYPLSKLSQALLE